MCVESIGLVSAVMLDGAREGPLKKEWEFVVHATFDTR